MSSLIHSESLPIPPNLPPKIQGYLLDSTSSLSIDQNARDYLRWREASDGQLTLKAAWHLIRTRANPLVWPAFIWNGICLHKVSCFGWHLMHNKTPIELRLKRLGFSLASRCSICYQDEESTGHLFFNCVQAKALWSWVCHSAQIAASCNFSASSIWEVLSRGNDEAGRSHMAAIFIYVIFFMWKARNKAIFEAWKILLSFI
ncbi:hypothetical protein AAC387_Pa06g1445 [Persea americana]